MAVKRQIGWLVKEPDYKYESLAFAIAIESFESLRKVNRETVSHSRYLVDIASISAFP